MAEQKNSAPHCSISKEEWPLGNVHTTSLQRFAAHRNGVGRSKIKIAKDCSRNITFNYVGERLYIQFERLKTNAGKKFVANTIRHAIR